MTSSTHSISPSGSGREEGEWRAGNDDRNKRRLAPDSAAARTPRPDPVPYSEKRFRGQPEYSRIRYAHHEDWRKIALEEIDRRRKADEERDLYSKRVDHFENKSKGLQNQVAEADNRIKLLESQLKEAQSSSHTWQQQSAQTEEKLQQAQHELKEFETQLAHAEESLQTKVEEEKGLRANAAELTKQRDQANATVATLRTDIARLQTENEKSSDAVRNTKDSLSTIQGLLNSQKISYEHSLATLRREKAQLTKTSKEHETNAGKLQSQTQRTNEEKARLEKALEENRQKMQEVQQQLAREQKTVFDLRHYLATMRAQIDAKLGVKPEPN